MSDYRILFIDPDAEAPTFVMFGYVLHRDRAMVTTLATAKGAGWGL